MTYTVEFVTPGDLPEDHPWVLVKDGGDYVIFFDREQITPRVLEEAWAAFRCRSTGLPIQRRPAYV